MRCDGCAFMHTYTHVRTQSEVLTGNSSRIWVNGGDIIQEEWRQHGRLLTSGHTIHVKIKS